MVACKSTMDRKTPRFNHFLQSLAKKLSTVLSHAREVSVTWKTKRYACEP